MSRKTVIKFAIFIAFCAFAPILFQSCSGGDEAEYTGEIRAKVLHYDLDRNVVLSYKLGEQQVVDELPSVDENFYWFLEEHFYKELDLNIQATASSGGG